MFDTQCILAIDPALSTTGLAVIDYNQNILYFNKFKTSPKEDDTDRIHKIVVEVSNIARLYSVIDIVLEDGYIGANARTGLQLAALRGAIIEIFTWYGYPVHHMKPSEIRSMFGQKGNASKEEIAQAVIDFYGPENKFMIDIGPYSDKQNKMKTSDIYDAISIGLAYIRAKQSKLIL